MGRSATVILPKYTRLLKGVGDNIRLARLRRKLSAEQVATRAGISRSTLQKVEKGDPSTAVGNLLQVLIVLGLEEDFFALAENDPLGRKLQDANLLKKRSRAPRKSSDL
ncbi:MAG: helix-turn-helix transcriptional regulator [Verrucomicrobiota bacterium]